MKNIKDLVGGVCFLTNAIKFPTRLECAARSVCSFKFRLAAGGVDLSLALHGCLNTDECTSKRQIVDEVLSDLCLLPSCSILSDDHERALCMWTQLLLCDESNRFVLRPNVEEFFGVLCAAEVDDESVTEAKKILTDGGFKVLSEERMEALLSCGSGAFVDPLSIVYSGQGTGLGEYTRCIRHHEGDEYGFCLMEYSGFVKQGQCLPKSCSPRQYGELVNFICEDVGVQPNNPIFYGSRSCLDYVDTIPLTTCLSMQLLGCDPSAAPPLDDHDIFNKARNSRILEASLLGVPQDGATSALLNPDQFVNRVATYASGRHLAEQAGAVNHTSVIDSIFENSLTKDRYESHSHAYSLRCGGWTTSVDTSKFNRMMGVATVVAFFLLPFAVNKSWSRACYLNLMSVVNHGLALGGKQWSHICGLRVINMFWIVVAHTFTFSWQEGVCANFKNALEMFHQYRFQIIFSGQLAVDSFFLMSGLMFGLFGAHKLQNQLKTHRSGLMTAKSIAALILERYVRLMPSAALVLAFSYWVLPYLGKGPMWMVLVNYLRYGQDPVNRSLGCYKNWWRVVTLTNNLATSSSEGLDCLGHTWYLANDFQFYILGCLLVVISVYSSRKWMWSALLAVYAAASVYSFIITVRLNLHFSTPAFSDTTINPGGVFSSDGMKEALLHWTSYYVRPWCRVGPYLIGFVAGVAHRDGLFQKYISHPTKFEASVAEAEAAEASASAAASGSAASECALEAPPGASNQKGLPSPSALEPRPSAQPAREPGVAGKRVRMRIQGTDSSEAHLAVRQVDTHLVYFWSTICALVMFVSVFTIPYAANKSTKMTWNPTLDQIWFVMNRSLWAAALAWFCLLLAQKSDISSLCLISSVDAFLSNKFFAVSSVFTFAFYLVHPLVEQWYYANRVADSFLTNVSGWTASVSHFVLTVAYGVVLTVVAEVSLHTLTGRMFRGLSARRSK